jgi:hypothetical protein
MRVLFAILILLFVTITSFAQTNSTSPFVRLDLIKSTDSPSKPLAEDDPFVAPKDSILKLQRQAEFHLLPADFFPDQEKETNAFRRKALRYAVAYYRDCEVPGFRDFRDVMLGLRLDTRNGALEIRYYRTALIIDPFQVQFPEDSSALAVLPQREATALALFSSNGKQQLIAFEGLFTDNPRPTNFLGSDDVDGLKADPKTGKFIFFVRGGGSRAALFAIVTDLELQQVTTLELLRDLANSDRAFIFEILPSTAPTFRTAGAPVK